ncbi:CidA/LrgA family protein [Thalassotalea castellviae]|uniref:CidA/LrgA family protein n=1 Tax=Thalassotalea castellviae TaxID=3075612 RepID=A0ABU2ZZR0_9GAMM|nr:CidA/LrgA family protein [Thalassotalea sp. W431]MDT0603394.1 CidA/LrgA family protein [Thalassotalea sp. W431]
MFNSIYTVLFISICLLIGYFLNHLLGGLPASLYGMVVFTLLLHFRVCEASRVKASIAWGIKNMGVCFVPAGVGIINHYQLIKTHGLMLVTITFIGTLMVLTFVGLLFQHLENKGNTVD